MFMSVEHLQYLYFISTVSLELFGINALSSHILDGWINSFPETLKIQWISMTENLLCPECMDIYRDDGKSKTLRFSVSSGSFLNLRLIYVGKSKGRPSSSMLQTGQATGHTLSPYRRYDLEEFCLWMHRRIPVMSNAAARPIWNFLVRQDDLLGHVR